MVHRHKSHSHASVGFARLYHSACPYLTRWHIEQQLDESSGRRWLRSADVHPTQRQIVQRRDKSCVGSLPGQNRPFWTGKTKIATKVVRGRHVETPKRTILSSSSQLKIFRSRLQSALSAAGLLLVSRLIGLVVLDRFQLSGNGVNQALRPIFRSARTW